MIAEIDAITKRLERLERQNRFLKRAVVAVLLLVVVAGLKAQQRSTRTIEAEKFVLLDSNGRARLTIGTPQSSGVAIFTPMDEPSIWISDTHGMDRLMLTTEGLRMANDRGKPAASLTFTKEGGAEILLHGDDGKLLYHAP